MDDVPLRFEANRTAPGIVPSLQAISNSSSIEAMFWRCGGDLGASTLSETQSHTSSLLLVVCTHGTSVFLSPSIHLQDRWCIIDIEPRLEIFKVGQLSTADI